MATTIETIRTRPAEPRLGLGTHTPSPPEPRPATWADRFRPHAPVSGPLAAGLGLAWLIGYPLGLALEPLPDDPAAAQGLLAVLTGTVFLAALATTAGGLWLRRRWGVLASITAGVMLLGMAVACPATGHHEIGLWWFGQLAVAAGLVGAGRAVLRRT